MNLVKDSNSRTAILLFAQSENVESIIKPIFPSAKQNVLLWKKMNGNALKTIQKTKLSYFISTEKNQVGTSFGEKITNAIQHVFDQGFEKVIVIGNDCIELKSHHLLQADRDLKTNYLVIGSDYSGGAYLIGVRKSTFNFANFQRIPWQSKDVFTALQSLYKEQSIAYLPFLNDCDDASDFKKAIHKLSFSDDFRKLLLSFFNSLKVKKNSEIKFISTAYQAVNFNKGSPFHL